MKNTIYIYQDNGVSEESVLQTITTLKPLLAPTYWVKTINANEVINGAWIKDAALFVMPGGSDLPYVRKLKGAGNQIIKEYVKKGGSYLGICAGSYYAAAYVEFDKSGGQEVLGDRELAFFPGKAIGPVLAKYHPKSNRGVVASALSLALSHIKESAAYYNGGGYFEDADKFPHVTVLGYYENNLPSIIQIAYHKGQVILSGVHIEYDPALLNANDPHLQHIIPILQEHDASRRLLMIEILKQLGIESKKI